MALYKVGEQKIRPGVYRRYENAGGRSIAGAVVGIFAIPVKADFGPLGDYTVFGADEYNDMKKLYGTGGTVDAALALFDGGATKVGVYRLGSGGSVATVDLMADGETATKLATLNTKYTTAREYNITIKDDLNDTKVRQLLVYLDDELLETIKFAKSTDESVAFKEAVNTNSAYLTVPDGEYGTGAFATVANTKLTGGEAPTVTTESYSDAFTAFETFTFNTLVLDTCETAVQALAKAYIDRIYNNGSLSVLAIGEPKTVDFETRLTHAKAFNSEKVIYFGSGYKDADGNEIDGYLAVAKQAGIVCSLSSNQSCVHTVLSGAVDLLEKFTNSDYENAIKGGMVLLSKNSEGHLWFDSGMNTLITPNAEQDDGWKKIKRTAVRFEMFDRIHRSVEPIVGKVNCDNVGVGDVIVTGNKVLEAMSNEKKIAKGYTFIEDTEFKRGSDFANFIISAYDFDSLEKIYLRYQFRFTQE